MILIVAVGQKQPAWVNEAFNDYAKRLPPEWAIELKEIKAEPRNTGKTSPQMMAAEAARINEYIRATLPNNHRITTVALDQNGIDMTSDEFCKWILRTRSQHKKLAFVIGGPDGLDNEFKSKCANRIRLSSMTLPHGLARVLLSEQIYRAWSINSFLPYHRS